MGSLLVSFPPILLAKDSTYDLERVCNNANSHKLLSIVTSVHHQGVGQALDDGALCLSESLLCISAGGVGDVDRSSDLDVIAVKSALLAQSPSRSSY